jgi:hypothetical protein
VTNALFDPGREGFLLGEINWSATPTIKVVLTRSYTFTASHKFVSDTTGAGAVLISTVTLGSRSGTNGIANSSVTLTFPAVPTQAGNASATSMLIFMSSAVTGGADVATSAQRLIAYIDSATNLPVVPNGGDITVGWDSGSNKIFKL